MLDRGLVLSASEYKKSFRAVIVLDKSRLKLPSSQEVSDHVFIALLHQSDIH